MSEERQEPPWWRTPIGLATAARALLAIASSDQTGLVHVGGPERMSRLEMGQRLASLLGTSSSSIIATDRSSAPAAEPRPHDTSLDSSCWRQLFPNERWPSYEASLQEMGVG